MHKPAGGRKEHDYKMQNSKYIIKHLNDSGKTLFINMLSGQVHEKTEDTEKIFTLIENHVEEKALKDYEEEIKLLKNKKFIFENIEEEYVYIHEVLERAAGCSLRSWTFFLHLTYDCNLSCTYCNYKDIPRERKFMTQEGLAKAFKLMRKIREEEEPESMTVVLFGGEPFLPDNRIVLEEFFRKFRELKEENAKTEVETKLLAFSNGVEIINNGGLLCDNRDMISSIYVTVNGPDYIHNRTRKFPDGRGSYEKTLEGIHYLLEKGIPTWMVANISRENIEYLPYIHNLIEAEGFPAYKNFLGCCVSRIKNRFEDDPQCLPEHEFLDMVLDMKLNGGLELKYFNFEDMRILKNIIALFGLEKAGDHTDNFKDYCLYGCGNRINQYTFAADGLIYPCSASAGNLRYAIGRLGEESYLLGDKKSYWTKQSVLDKSMCRQCKMAFICGGGCMLEGREKNKSWDKSYCPEAEKIVHSYFRCVEQGIHILNRETVYESEGK